MEDLKNRQRSTDEIFCWNCGKLIFREAVICIHCGVAVAQNERFKPLKQYSKSKTTAVLLAVFLGPWSFLYTSRTCIWKFVLGFLSPFVLFLLLFIIWKIDDAPWEVRKYTWPIVGVLNMVIWLWAIFDRVTKANEWYDNYSNL